MQCPMSGHPSLLNTGDHMLEVVVVTNRMPVLEVQVEWLGVSELGSAGLATLVPGSTVHLVVN
jgi:hypothetical protein